MYENPEKNSRYQQYRESGGIINEEEYESAFMRAHNTTTTPKKALIQQVELIAGFAGIELHNTEDTIDERIVLYGILRTDVKPEKVQYHHSQMSDQRLFAEVLRMLGDADALGKLIKVYHKGGTYCPICLKVAAPGEECR